jgi:hypothetical protein
VNCKFVVRKQTSIFEGQIRDFVGVTKTSYQSLNQNGHPPGQDLNQRLTTNLMSATFLTIPGDDGL